MAAASKPASIIDERGEFILLDIPSSSFHDGLIVQYRDICFEIGLDFPETRGPAETLIGLDKDLNTDLAKVVEETVDYLNDLVTGKIVMDICRYRFLWFKPYFLAWFRDSSAIPHKHTVRTVRWNSRDTQIS